MMRQAEIIRKTGETDVRVFLNLDGKGTCEISTGVGFLDHMLELFARHGRFDLQVTCKGDTRVDDHHSVEDIGIALGQAFDQALGERKGIVRYGQMILPMDESLILSAADLSGRGLLVYSLQIPTEKVGTFDTELTEEFLRALAHNARCTLHVRQLAGSNSHHIIEGAFKSVARSLRAAVADKLRETGLDRVVREEAAHGKPLMGICLGMQLLFERSVEYGEHKGLGLLKGEIRPIAERIPADLKIPQMGWNALKIVRESPLFKYTKDGEYVYFVHSYSAVNCEESLLASTEYGADLTACVGKDNVFGCQFHPEKSGETGLRMLKAFCETEAGV